MTDVRIYPAALRALVASSGVVGRVAREMRDEARVTASQIAGKTDANAITVETGADAVSVYADIGYAKAHPGFFLWWWEVGTQNHEPLPHLRPTLRPRL